MPCFFEAMLTNPRTVCFCHLVAFMISARVAPLARAIISSTFAPLLSGRGPVALARGALAVLASFLGLVGLALPLATFWPVGAPFFWVAAFFEESVSGAPGAPCAATVAALSLVLAFAFFILVLVILFCAGCA